MCNEVWPGDGDSTSSRQLASQPGRCARAQHADACASAVGKRFTTRHSSTPVHCSQVPHQFAAVRERHRTALAAATSLLTVPLVRQRLAS